MAKHYLGVKQQAYVDYREQGMNMGNSVMKAFPGSFSSIKSASNYGSKLEATHKLVRPAIIKGLEKKKAKVDQRQDEIINKDLSRIKDVADLGQVKRTIQTDIHKLESNHNGHSRAQSTYDTSLDANGFPPPNCSGKTFQGNIPRREGGPKIEGRRRPVQHGDSQPYMIICGTKSTWPSEE